MNLDLMWWGRLGGWLLVEVTLLVLVAGASATRLPQPRARRVAWLAGAAAIAVVLLAELAGLRRHWNADSPDLTARSATVVVHPAATTPASTAHPPAETPGAPPAPSRTSVPILWPGMVWLAGTALLLLRSFTASGWWWMQSRRMLSRSRGASTLPDPAAMAEAARLQRALGLRDVRILIWPGLPGPVAFGGWRPTVAVPPDFSTRFTPVQQAAMLAHELGHLAGRDPLWRWMTDFIVATLWWHPAVWWLRREIRSAGESVADEAASLVSGGPTALAESLVAYGREFSRTRASGAGGSGRDSELTRRVRALLAEVRPASRLTPFATASMALVAVAVAVGLVAVPLAWGNQDAPATDLARVLLAQAAPDPTTAPARRFSVGQRVTPESPEWRTRSFKIDPEHFRAGVPLQPGSTTNSADVVRDLQALLRDRGLTNFLNTTPDTSVGRGLFYDDQRGVLLVRASAMELEHLEQVLTELQVAASPAVPIATPVTSIELAFRVVEISEREGEIGLDWLFSRSTTNNPILELRARQPRPVAGTDPDWGSAAVTERLVTDGEAVRISSNQLASLLQSLDRRPGVSVLAAPRVITSSGRSAEISISDSPDRQPTAPGLTIVATPTETANGLELVLRARVEERVGTPDEHRTLLREARARVMSGPDDGLVLRGPVSPGRPGVPPRRLYVIVWPRVEPSAPGARAGAAAGVFSVEVTAGGPLCRWNGQALTADALIRSLKDFQPTATGTLTLEITSGRDVPMQRITDVIAAAGEAGVTRVTMKANP